MTLVVRRESYQMACPRKGSWIWSLGSDELAEDLSTEGSMDLVVRSDELAEDMSTEGSMDLVGVQR